MHGHNIDALWGIIEMGHEAKKRFSSGVTRYAHGPTLNCLLNFG